MRSLTMRSLNAVFVISFALAITLALALAITLAITLAIVASAGPANAAGDCFFKVYWQAGSGGSCGPGQGNLVAAATSVYECQSGDWVQGGDIGAEQGGCRIPVQEIAGYSSYTSQCGTTGANLGPVILSGCGGDLSLPSAPKAGANSCDARKDLSGLAGDPIDLKTGALSLDPVDVDLGGRFRFSRHYASNAPPAAPPSYTALPNIGSKWSHSLSWNARRNRNPSGNANPVIVITEPMRAPIPFLFDGNQYASADGNAGSIVVNANSDVHFTSSTGTEVDFERVTDSEYRLSQIRVPGELPIDVSPGPLAGETTFVRGTQSLVLGQFTGGPDVGKISSVTANAETWSYTYLGGLLRTVEGPDPTTTIASDTTTWTYTYRSTTPSGLLVLVERETTSDPTRVTLGAWNYGGANRVISADEQALEQALSISYAVSAGILGSTVRNSSGELLAVFKSKYNAATSGDPRTSTTGVITSVTNSTGPVAGVPGGAGVEVPFIAQTTISSDSPLINVRTNKRGHKTLYESYDDRGRPGTIVEGWVDGPTSPGVYSSDDTFASRRDVTQWHPVLWAPLNEESPSVLSAGMQHETIYDFDDPSTPNDDGAVPNEAPTNRLYERTETGYTRDAAGAVVPKTYTTTFTYDAVGHLETVEGPRTENYTEHDYDPTTGYRTATRRYTDGEGSAYLETTFSSFDSRGNPQTVTDPNGKVTTYTYDTRGRVKTVTPPYTGASSTIMFTYDIDGNVKQIDFPPDSFSQAYFLSFGYDTKNRLTHITDAAGDAIVYERTAGRVTRQTRYTTFVDLSNRGTIKGDASFEFDSAGRLDKAINPLFSNDSVFTAITPDENGNPEVVTDENGNTDTRIYDALDRLTALSQARGGTTYATDFQYDWNSNLTKITDPSAKDTDYEFDDFGRLVMVTSPNTGQTLYAYDAEAGIRITKKENFAGAPRTTKYTYDGLDRLKLVDLPTDADLVFAYDGSDSLNQKGRLTSASDGAVTTVREYFPRGDLRIERTTIGGASYEVEYDYDAAGRRTSVQPPSGVKSVYEFSGDRPKTITVNPGANQQVVQDIAFDPFGGRISATFPPSNSVSSERSYNLRGQVASVQVTSPAGSVLDRSFVYAYTAGGVGPNDPGPNLDYVLDNRDATQSRLFFYDSLDRLWKVSSTTGSSLYLYYYDANGNRTLRVSGRTYTGTTYEAGTDRINSSGFSYGYGSFATYFQHDAFGNRIWQSFSSYSGTPSNTYDEQNQLIGYEFAPVPILFGQYTYDAFGRRVRKVTSSGTTLFFYDAAGNLVEERSLATTPNSVRNYVWLEDEPAGIVDSGSATLAFSWVHTDYLGMPIAVTNTPATGNAQTIWRANYAPFGQARILTDPDGDGQHFAFALRFPGQYADSESPYVYNRFRYYDPSVGRYISADPLGQVGGINPYTYALNSPINRTDRYGLYAGLAVPGAGAAAAGRQVISDALDALGSAGNSARCAAGAVLRQFAAGVAGQGVVGDLGLAGGLLAGGVLTTAGTGAVVAGIQSAGGVAAVGVSGTVAAGAAIGVLATAGAAATTIGATAVVDAVNEAAGTDFASFSNTGPFKDVIPNLSGGLPSGLQTSCGCQESSQ